MLKIDSKNKKIIIATLFGVLVLILIALIFLPSWLKERNNVSAPSEENYKARLMEQDEKLRYQINPESEVEVVKDSEGDFIYQIKK